MNNKRRGLLPSGVWGYARWVVPEMDLHKIGNTPVAWASLRGIDMRCELSACCQFFKDKMKDMPMAAQYIRSRLCSGDYASCSRYKIYQEFGRECLPPHLNPDDSEEVNKVIECLRMKREFNPE